MRVFGPDGAPSCPMDDGPPGMDMDLARQDTTRAARCGLDRSSRGATR